MNSETSPQLPLAINEQAVYDALKEVVDLGFVYQIKIIEN